jgi:hypothetical protein
MQAAMPDLGGPAHAGSQFSSSAGIACTASKPSRCRRFGRAESVRQTQQAAVLADRPRANRHDLRPDLRFQLTTQCT